MTNFHELGLAYLATPYTNYRPGLEMAFMEACKIAAEIVKAGGTVYSPIAMTHPVAKYGCLDMTDHDLWMDFDIEMVGRCDVLLVAMMEGWDKSAGIQKEIAWFKMDGKPILYLDPATMEVREVA